MTIASFYRPDPEVKRSLLFQCCGSENWVERVLSDPLPHTVEEMLETASDAWYACTEADWRQAFAHHPRIGDMDALKKKFSSDQFAGKEQSGIAEASGQVLEGLAAGNHLYEEKFGFIFIVFATGKSASEMLDMLNARLSNDPEVEVKIAMQEQLKITLLRLQKLFTQ